MMRAGLRGGFIRGLLTLALLIAASFTASLACAQAAQLSVPDYPPDRQGCAAGWRIGSRVVSLDDGAAFLIEAAYDPALASGRLQRKTLGATMDAVTVGPALWDAAAVLDGGAGAGGPMPEKRTILTLDARGQTVPFEWGSLDDDARAALDPAGDGLGPARLAYLRGERDREGAPFRRRTTLLGDIVRSRPLLVAAPSGDGLAVGAPGYADFYQRYRKRQRLVWVGAGDGMLHAFDWSDGSERFAYLPRALLPSVHRLTGTASEVPAGAASTRVAVDGAPGQGEALLGGRWRTVLAAGMGMSARGLFALDITDPTEAPAALWEFTERDDAAMGYLMAAPMLVKLRWNSGGVSAAPAFRYFVLTANGFNASDGGADGALFLLALDKAPTERWRRGENYYRLRARARDQAEANALAPPALAVNADGSARYAYAGDLQGALWRFDLENLDDDGEVLFRARAADGADQAITEAAQLVFAPGGGYLVLFGTGRTIESADFDLVNFSQQSFYAVRDTDARPIVRVTGRDALAERKLTGLGSADGLHIAGTRFDFNGAGKAVRHGWFFDYGRSLQDGERTATAPVLAGPAVIVTSTAPGADRCAPTVRSYVLDSLSGVPYDRRGLPAYGYLDGSGGAVTGRALVSRDGSVPLMLMSTLPPNDPAGAASPTPTGATRAFSSVRLIQFSGEGASVLERVVVSRLVGRLNWREIVNWTELHRAAVPNSPH